jgi:hypothetical protein
MTDTGSPMKSGSNRRPVTPRSLCGAHLIQESERGHYRCLMHHPIQCRYPEWDDNFDIDASMAKKTRREFCERYADSGGLVFGTHFALPSHGKISKREDSFRFSLAGKERHPPADATRTQSRLPNQEQADARIEAVI